ncbi:MAG: hypothetical protein WCL70_01585 [Paludibacter sp.]
MDYNFGKFIEESKNSCKTKSDFISKIDKEKALVSEIHDGLSYELRTKYSKSLDIAKFYAQTGVITESDEYSDDLRMLVLGFR